jgi:6-phospho 3-hexuloisomerase
MHRQQILEKIENVLAVTPDEYEAKLITCLDQARRIFVCGAGRSKLVGNFLAMRLMHGGYAVSVIGEVVTPSIGNGDVFVVISGSGETEQLIGFTRKAKSVGARILLISSRDSSSIADLADEVLQIGEESQYNPTKGMPMGTMFELSALIFLEAVVSHLIHEKDIPEEEMRERHANLE